MSGTTSDLGSVAPGASEYLQSLDWPRRGQTESLVIRAGAGAGKTTELVKRVLSLILNFRHTQQRNPRLVVTTFTRKATQELRERLLLGALTLNDPDVLRFVQQSKSLQISTIHGTLRRFLSSFGPAAGLSPEFRVMDTVDESRLKKKNLRRLLEQPEESLHFEKLLEDWDLSGFWRAYEIWSEHKFLHPEAEPETAEQIATHVLQQLLNLELVATSFVEMSASETLTENRQNFVAFVQGVLQAVAQVQARKNISGPERLGQLHQLWKDTIENLPRKSSSKSWSAEFAEAQDSLYERWKEMNREDYSAEFRAIYAANLEHFQVLAHGLWQRIESEKAQRSELSLKDLELWTLKILKANPETGQQFGAQWDYWMIDEFQDTSPVQVQILDSLMGDRNGFIVGDPQQSIYLFRGARSEVFARKETEIQAQGGRGDQLMTNYRSSPKLMNFLNRFLTEIEPRQFAPMQIGGKADTDFSGPQALFWNLPGDSEFSENEALLSRVQELLKQGIAAEKICVLGRANAPLADFCRRAAELGVPTRFSGAAGFADRREVRDALAFLRFLVNPHDNLVLLTLLRSPWFAVGDQELSRLSDQRKGESSLWQVCLEILRDQSQVFAGRPMLEVLLKSLRRADERGLTQAWVMELIERGFIDESLRLDASGQRESHFWRLLADLKFQEREPGFNVLKWIEKIEIGQVTDEKSDDEAPAVIEPSRVQVMTIHASKGLQFDHILLGGAGKAKFANEPGPLKVDENSGRFSLGVKGLESAKWVNSHWAQQLMETQKQREIQEFDRFLYVALTRAIRGVTIVWKKEVKNSWMLRRPLWTRGSDGLIDIADSDPAFRIELRSSAPVLEVLESEAMRTTHVRKMWREPEAERRREQEIVAASPWSRFEKIQVGVDVHRALELLQSDWDHDKSERMLNLKSRLREVTMTVPDLDLRTLIEKGYVEWAFMVKVPARSSHPESWVSGRIDLWGIIRGPQTGSETAWIVDYKTGTARSRAQAVIQLQIYAWTLQRLGKIPPGCRVRLLPLYLAENVEATYAEECSDFQTLDDKIHQLFDAHRGSSGNP